eukprot:TRINITY_DN12057_c6_g5_i2.p4 TRINITY_DN12057_c6_g5~~TRINITY_DN12057_c6_g5_i2.p4  ORF type:complete len:148 (+),score=24.85 TRINITY_DN12057_c6_g5_i2:797-1240(+)
MSHQLQVRNLTFASKSMDLSELGSIRANALTLHKQRIWLLQHIVANNNGRSKHRLFQWDGHVGRIQLDASLGATDCPEHVKKLIARLDNSGSSKKAFKTFNNGLNRYWIMLWMQRTIMDVLQVQQEHKRLVSEHVAWKRLTAAQQKV